MGDASEERIHRDIDAIAAFNESDPRLGFNRPTFSPSWRKARDYVAHQAQETGCEVRVDAAGNLHARPSWLGWQRKAWLCGSHVDSVPTGGRFDGVTGVAVALEVLRAAPAAAVELVVFAEEEGTTFGLGMLGSRAWTGTISVDALGALRNGAGETYLAAGAAQGVAPERLATGRLSAQRLAADRLDPALYHGLIECHVEQGPGMWNAGTPVAIVTAIAGRRQYLVTLTGQANHAGATRMRDRRDALAGAAEIVTGLEALGREMDARGGHTVLTVGKLEVEPNAVNVIAGKVAFTVDFRSQNDNELAEGEERVRRLASDTSAPRGLALELSCTEKVESVLLNDSVCRRLREAARRLGLATADAASGALHDTAILAPLVPAAMLFVASRDGISHNPAEYSRMEDIAAAARIIAEAVTA